MEEGVCFEILGFSFRNIRIEQCQVEEKKKKITEIIEQEVREMMRQMGIIYSRESELDLIQRVALNVTRRWATFAHGTVASLAQLSSGCRSAILRINSYWNATNVYSEIVYRYIIHNNKQFEKYVT